MFGRDQGPSRKMAAAMQGVLASALLFCGGQSMAAVGGSEGTVTWVSVYGDGSALVFGFTFTNNGCTSNGAFRIPASHPNRQSLLALILSAKASGIQLQVTAKTDNCWYPEITQDTSTLVSAFPQ